MIPEDSSTPPDDENQGITPPAAFDQTTPDRTVGPVLNGQQPHSTPVPSSSLHPPKVDANESTPDEFDFDQLIEVGDFEEFGRHLPTLGKIWGVEDQLIIDDYVPKDDECVIRLLESSLRNLVNVLECAVPPLPGQHGTVRLTVEKQKLSGRSYYNEAFCDVHVDLATHVHLVDDHTKLVFIVAFDDLRATQKGVYDQVRLTYSVKKHQLTVSSGRFERPLQIEPERLFIDHSNVEPNVTENTSPVCLPSSVLLAYLTYVSSQTPTNKFDLPINVTQVRDGLAISGTTSATAVARYKGLGQTNVTVHNKNLQQLLQFLRQMNHQDVRVRVVDNHYFLDAGRSTFGFARPWKVSEAAETPKDSDLRPVEQQFPVLEHLLVFEDYEHEILFPTKALLNVLRALQSADEPTLSVRFAVKDDKRQPKCAFSVRYADRKQAKILVESHSLKPRPDDPSVDINLSLKPLLDAVAAVQGRDTKISVWKVEQIVRISDTSELDFQTFLGWECQGGIKRRTKS